MAAQRIAVVTGANKGLGFAIVRAIALRYHYSKLSRSYDPTNSTPVPCTLYLAARGDERGYAAVEALKQDRELLKAGVLVQSGGLIDIVFKKLDVTDGGSIASFSKSLMEDHRDAGIDVLVNNAGVSLGGPPNIETAERTIATNFTGLLAVTRGLLPLLARSQHSRVVNMSSMLGKLSIPKFSPEILGRFTSASTVDDVTRLMEDYQASVADGTWEKDGWPGSPYAVSKAGVTGATMLLGKNPNMLQEMLSKGIVECSKPLGKILINACCPGYVKTDMTGNRGRKSPDQGAKMPVHLALGDIGEVNGEFWENEEVSSWYTEGKPDLRRSSKT